jgi:hypothetical protein
MYNYFISNKSIRESFSQNFPSNFCSIINTEDRCQTNWQKRPWFANTGVNASTLAGNPCSWTGNTCVNSSFSKGWDYGFTRPPLHLK